MPSTSASKRFLQVYDALPPDAQQLLVQHQLAPLLDAAPKQRQKRATTSATEMRRRYSRMPALDLKAKKQEIAALMFELSREKRSVIKERSRREQLLAEAVDSLAHWLNDIWKVVFEFRTNFALAHACLLFACDALDRIGNSCGGCKCSLENMFMPIRIARSTGKVVKSFMLNGAQNLQSIILWVWRDLLMTILATGSKRQRSSVSDMIDDIRTLLGWRALELLLCGGHYPFSDQDPAQEDQDPAAHDPEEALEYLVVDDDGDQNYISDNCSSACDEELYPKNFYASHWSWRFTDQQYRLRDLVHTALLNLFKDAPTGALYSSLIIISEDEDSLEEELHPLLMSVAGRSSDNLSAALRILSLNNRTDSINQLLIEHKHLLRPQDAASLQFAVLVLSSNFLYRTHVMSIAEEELHDVLFVLRSAIRLCFCNIYSEANKAELKQILVLRSDTLARRTRVERWVKGIAAPRGDTAHPMALAALMIGLPLPPGEGTDEGDILGYMDLDGDEPDVEELREEFRPNIKARFQGWVDTVSTIKGGHTMLLKVYGKILADMPFLNAKDVVEEMLARLADRPSKLYVSDALEAFRGFCEKQSSLVNKVAKAKSRAKTASASRAPIPGSTSSVA